MITYIQAPKLYLGWLYHLRPINAVVVSIFLNMSNTFNYDIRYFN